MTDNPNDGEVTTPTSPSDGNKPTDNSSGESSDPGAGTDSGGESGEPKGGKLSAEERINQLVSRQKELEDKLKEVGRTAPVPETTGKPTMTPSMQKAKEQLKKIGVVFDEDQEEKVRSLEDRLVLNTEHARLESQLDGSDGRPKYDRASVEAHMRERGIYDPQAAYENLHKEEMIDWYVKQAAEHEPTTPKSETPSAAGQTSGDGNVITREMIREKMTTPEWKQWYEKNHKTIMTLMQKGQLA